MVRYHYHLSHLSICVYVGVVSCFLPESGSWAGLRRTLRISCATTVPSEFWLRMFLCPVLVLLSCSFLPVCVSASPCIFLSENRSSSFYLFTQCIAMCMFVFLTGRHGLGVNFGPEACAFSCADLGWTILSLAGLLLIVNLQFCLPTYRGDFSTEPAWDCQCDKQKSDAELLSIQNCVEDKYNYHNNMVVS